MQYLQHYCAETLQTKSHYDANFVITGSTGGCHNNNLQYHHWWKRWHNPDSQFSESYFLDVLIIGLMFTQHQSSPHMQSITLLDLLQKIILDCVLNGLQSAIPEICHTWSTINIRMLLDYAGSHQIFCIWSAKVQSLSLIAKETFEKVVSRLVVSTALVDGLAPADARPSGPHLNIKTVLSTYGYFHVKDKTAVRTSYL